MKKLLTALLAWGVYWSAFAQCPTTSAEITVMDYCPSQYAEFVVDNPDPATMKYHWFTDNGGGNYVSDGYTDHYISPDRYPTGTGDVDAFYSVEINDEGGPTFSTGMEAGYSSITSDYSVEFTITADATINEVSIALWSYYVNPGNFNVQLSFENINTGTTIQTDAFDFGVNNLQLVANSVYQLPVPLSVSGTNGVTLEAGTYRITANNTGLSSDLSFAGMQSANFNNSYDIGGELSIDYTSNVQGGLVSPFFDWDVQINCPMQTVTAEETYLNCCRVVSDFIDIASSTGSYTVESPFSITLTASGDDTLNYRWYKDGIAIPGAEGQGDLGRTLIVNQVGNYTVRAVDSVQYIDRYSCFVADTAYIQERMLYIDADMTDLCMGESANLVARGATGAVQWYAPPGVINAPTERNVTATPPQTMTISVEAEVPAGNQVVNGDFEQGFLPSIMDISSEYNYVDPAGAIVYEDQYQNPDNLLRLDMANGDFTVNESVFYPGHSFWANCHDHTTGSGQFLYADTRSVNPAPNPVDAYVWEQDVVVQPNTEYEFAAWFTNITTVSDPAITSPPQSLPEIMIYINDEPIMSSTYTMDGTVCLWQKVSEVWNSGSLSGIVNLKIANTNFDQNGNDWAMDDISFGTPSIQRAEVTLSVDDCLFLEVSNDTAICAGDTVNISAITNGVFLGWTPNENIALNLNESTYVYPTVTTSYVATTKYQLGNLIVNGDFESGANVGYTIPAGITAGYVTNPKIDLNNQYYASIQDHTSGSGSMLLFDPGNATEVYYTNVTVEAGVEYVFSAWIANAIDYTEQFAASGDTSTLAVSMLRFYVDGMPLTNFDAVRGSNDWVRSYSTWTATTSGTVTISLSSEVATSQGNDFAIDDISFAPMVGNEITDTITITVDDCLPDAVPITLHYCEDLPVGSGSVAGIDLTAFEDTIMNFSTTSTVTWYTNAAATLLVPAASLTNYTATDGTVLYAQVSSGAASNIAEVTFVVNPLPDITFPTIAPQCFGDTLEITGVTPAGGVFSGDGISSTGTFVAETLGVNTITYTDTIAYDSISCSASKDLEITVNAIPETDWDLTLTTDTTYCGTDGVDLYVTPVTGADSYTWSDAGSTSAVYSGATAGTYTVTVEKDGCSYTTREITVAGSEVPTFTLTGGATYCPSDEKLPLQLTILTGTPPFDFTYIIDAGTVYQVNDTVSPATIDVTLEGEYILTSLVDSNGCEATDFSSTTTVGFDEVPEIIFDDISDVCVSEPTVDVGGTYVTFPSTAGTASFTTSRGSITNAGLLTLDGEGEYIITASFEETGNICPAVKVDTLIVNPLPTITFDPASPATCVDIADTIMAIGADATAPYSYRWSSADGILTSAPALQSAIVESATAGTYTMACEVTDDNGCIDTAYVDVSVNGSPQITIDPLGPFCASDDAGTISVTTVPATGNGVFSGTGVDAATGEFNPVTAGSAASPHTITYTFTDNNGCANSETLDITVNALPVVTITPSETDPCISGNNSDTVTFTYTGATGGSGTFPASLNSISFVDSDLGIINPSDNASGVYSLYYVYTDGNNCIDTAEAEVEIHALPAVSFAATNPTQLCVYDDNIVLDVLPDASGTFSRDVTSSTFSPVSLGSGDYNILYTYRDTYGCEDTANYQIEVIEVPVPDIISDNPKTVVVDIADQLTGTTELEAATNVTGAIIDWFYGSNTNVWQANSPVLNTGVVADSIDDAIDLMSFYYNVRQLSRGCYSDPVDVELVLSRCPALAPQAEDAYYCIDETGPFTITATQTTGSPGDRLGWFANAGDTDPMVGFDGVATFASSTITGSIVETQTVYVAEYDNESTCWSSKTAVTIHVVDTPSISITTASLDVCYENGDVPVYVSPAGGTLTGSDAGFSVPNRLWDLDVIPFTLPEKYLDLVYRFNDTLPDGHVCRSVTDLTITAHFIDPPTPHDRAWLISDIANLPANILTADRSTGVSVEWYDDANATTLVNTGDGYTPNITDLEAEAAGLTELIKTYYIRQIDATGCASELVPIVLSLVQCPYNPPTVDSIVICAQQPLDDLVATEFAGTNHTGWKWYDASGSDLTNNSSNFAHGVDNTVAGVTYFEVSYTAIEPNSGNECETERTPVSVTVQPLPVIEFATDLEAIVCYGADALELRHTVDPVDANKVWSVFDQSVNAAAGGYFDTEAYGETTDTYTIQLTATDDNGCVDSARHDLLVQYTPKPEVTHIDRLTVFNTEPLLLEATPNSGATNADISWYSRSGSSLNNIGNGTPYDMPESQFTSATGGDTFEDISVNYMYARQSINGCMGDTARLKIVIRECPAPQPQIGNYPMCDYDTEVDVEATYGTWISSATIPEDPNKELRWFTTDGTPANMSVYNTGEIITIPRGDVTGTTTTFYVAEYSPREDCYSELRAFDVSIDIVAPLSINVSDVCEGSPLPIATLSSGLGSNTARWYETAPGALPITDPGVTGNTYPVTNSTVAVNTVWAIVDNGHCQSTVFSNEYEIRARPEPTVVAPAPACEYEENVVITATASQSGSQLRWYSDTTTSALFTGENFDPAQNILSVGDNTFYCKETSVNVCHSFAVPVVYVNKEEPAAPTNESLPICEYEAAPMLSKTPAADYENVRWYDGSTLLAEGTTYQFPATNMNSGGQTVVYNITHFKDGCETQTPGTYTVNVIARPDAPTVRDNGACFERANPEYRTTDRDEVYWYRGLDSLSGSIFFGGRYTPDDSDVGNYDYGVVTINPNSGCRSELSTFVHSIQDKPVLVPRMGIWSCQYAPLNELSVSNINDNISVRYYYWNNSLGQQVEVTNNRYTPQPRDFSNTGDNVFTVVAESTIGCLSDAVEVVYDLRRKPDVPEIISIGNNVMLDTVMILCQGDELSPVWVSGLDVMWYNTYGDTLEYEPVFLPNLDSLVLSEDVEFTAIETIDQCSSDPFSLYVRLSEVPSATIIGDTKICEASYKEMYKIDQYNEGNSYIWDLDSLPEGIVVSQNENSRFISIDWSTPGLYQFGLTEVTTDGCNFTEFMDVSVAPQIIADFDWDLPGAMQNVVFENLTMQDSIIFKDTSILVPYTSYWNYGRTQDVFNNVHNYNQRNRLDTVSYDYGYYNVQLIAENDHGCIDSVTQKVFIDINYALYIPNAFSPSSSAYAVREFRPIGYNLKEYDISIFDTWGNLLWHSDKLTKDGVPAEAWDGVYEGTPIKSDTYIWKIKAVFRDGREWDGVGDANGNKHKYGNVILVR